MRQTFDDPYASMPWDKVDTVVFDIGNVLVTFGPDEMLGAMYPDDEAMRARLKRAMFASPYWVMLDRGTILREEAARLMAGGDETFRRRIMEALGQFVTHKRAVQGGVRVLRRCKEQGKRVLLLSNYGTESYGEITKKFDFFSLLDGGIISAYEKMVKPEREIYALLLSRYGLDGSRTLFLDDMAMNVEAALNAGLQSICFDEKTTPAFFGV
ncbi:MAG: hypothetical protein EOM69_10295 [Clostridia bacterium]|nr:hypothetical protein [Clostridia bacterium]